MDKPETLPKCVTEHVEKVRDYCADGKYDSVYFDDDFVPTGDSHFQPRPCGYGAEPDLAGECAFIARCQVAGCAVRDTTGFDEDCREQDEF